MKKLFIKSLLSLTILTSTILISPTTAHAEWKHDSTGWWYTTFFASPPYYIGWNEISNKWYYFYSNGYMAHDTVIEGYSIDSTGARQSKVSGSYYWGADLMHMDFHTSTSGSYFYADPVFNTVTPSNNKDTILDNLNNEYTNFLVLRATTDGSYSYIEFPLGGKYKQFTTKLGLTKDFQDNLEDGLVKITVDDDDIYTTNISSGDMLKDVSVDLTGKQKIRFYFQLNKVNIYGAQIGFFNGQFIN